MKFRFGRLKVVLTYVGTILFVFGLVLLVPLFYSLVVSGGGQDVRRGTFAVPIFVSLILGAACRWETQRWPGRQSVGNTEAMLICVLGWVAVSAVGALPFALHLRISYLDAYYEAVSGFTTTGATVLTGLDAMPRSLLLWRSLTQWIGGLGILTFFMALVFEGGFSHRLLGAESSKIEGPRIAPGVWHTLKVVWAIYVLWTVLTAVALCLCGLGVYDAVMHSLTTIAGGGFSPHDAGVAYFEQAGYAHHALIEYVIIVGMWVSGTSFLVHYRLLKGSVKALWDSDEMRAWWMILAVAFVLVAGSRLHALRGNGALMGETVRHSLFQVVSIGTTTGFGTRDIGSEYFTPLARQVFLVLMLVGGCAGSTAGGLKVTRIVVLWKLMVQQVRGMLKPGSEVQLLLLDRRPVSHSEVNSTAGLLFAWLFVAVIGAAVTAALSGHEALASGSAALSAVSNVGPSYLSVQQTVHLPATVKLVHIAAMLAGRLEIIPVLIFFSGRTWR
jgi:trk system potassium uptake protein TrkH